MLASKLRSIGAYIVGLKKYATLKTLSWLVPTVIIVVGLTVLFTVPATPVDVEESMSDEIAYVEAEMQKASLVGLYESGFLPAASTPGREFTLALAEDGTATFVGDYKTGDRLVDELGTWTVDGDKVTVTLTKRFGHELEVPMVYVFSIEDGALKLRDYDLSRWGYMGLTLLRPE